MEKFLARFRQTYFNPSLDLRVRLFNVLAIGGTLISILMAVLGLFSNSGLVNIAVNLIVAVLSFALLTYSRRTGRYQICYTVTIVGIFIGFFPMLFFTSGGYHSGMPAFFVFAVVFTIFMLEGKKAVLFSVAELLIYITICLIAYYRPETVNEFTEESDMLTDILVAFVTVSFVLGASMFLHFRLYNEQQKKLDEQNEILAQASRTKTEFLSNASHEMRTPLTVVSVNVQTVADILEDLSVEDPDAGELLNSAQSEIMRLARMVGGMLSLASMSENTDKQSVDFSALLQSSADMLRISIQKHGNTLETEIETGLRVFGNADLLAQVIFNLLQNAGAHTENGEITLAAEKNGGEISISVRDTGTGISPEMLPRVFERGVSSGGTGFGLYLCRTVVESHGGRIWIESEPGKGATAIFTLPFYEGQFGGEAI